MRRRVERLHGRHGSIDLRRDAWAWRFRRRSVHHHPYVDAWAEGGLTVRRAGRGSDFGEHWGRERARRPSPFSFGDALRLPAATLRSAYWSLVLRRSGRPFPPSLTHSTVVLYYQCIPSTSRSTLSLSPASQPAFPLQIPLPLSTIVYILVL